MSDILPWVSYTLTGVASLVSISLSISVFRQLDHRRWVFGARISQLLVLVYTLVCGYILCVLSLAELGLIS